MSEIVKKGVAVSTVILIILGIVVLGLLGYLLYNRFRSVPVALEDCRVIVATKYCPYLLVNIQDPMVHDYKKSVFNEFCQDEKNGAKGCEAFATQLGVYDKASVQATCGFTIP